MDMDAIAHALLSLIHVPLCFMQVLTMSASGETYFEEIFMFSHRDAFVVTNFVTIMTEDSSELTASPGHYIWATNDRSAMHLVKASAIAIGEYVAVVKMANLSAVWSRVVRKSESHKIGLYNPHTPSGTIVVDGVAASTFTDTLPPFTAMHTLVTMPARLIYLAFRAFRNSAACDAFNNMLLRAFFSGPWGTLSSMSAISM